VYQSATLVDVLHDRATQQPDRIAYTFLLDGENQAVHLTYRQLLTQATAIAAQLQSCCSLGDRALVLYPPGLEYITAFFGCLLAGVVAVPAYPPRPHRSGDRLQSLVANAQASVALTTPTLLTQIQTEVSGLQNLKWLTHESDWHPPASLPQIQRDTLAFLQYTSGSTAAPKGVQITHRNLMANLAAIHHQFHHSPASKGVIWLPPYHDMGLIGGILQPLYGGFPVVLMSPLMFIQSPIRWLRAISHHQATTSGGPSFAYEHCLHRIKPDQRTGLDLSHWQVAFNGAEPIQASVMAQFSATFAPYGFQRSAFHPCYGLAEATLMVSSKNTRVTPDSPTTLVSCGQPIPGHRVTIADPESLEPLPDGQVGEIWVAGESVAAGYWNATEESAATFQDNGFLRTGDLGFLDRGELFVTGRLKDLIIIRGQNYYPQDLEASVKNCHSSVSLNPGAAFAVEVEGKEQLVVIQEVDRPTLQQTDFDSLLGSIRQAITDQHDLQIHTLLLLKPGSIPRTSSGKIQRSTCRHLFLTQRFEPIATWIAPPDNALSSQPQPAPAAPPTEAEIQDWLVTHLANYLKVPVSEIDVSQPFAYYGLDSSVAVSLTDELAQWLQVEQLDPTLFWEYPSVEALTQHLGQPR
jgi:acyl-CoA synthetase (AMP-forming)/AMP-acid ligase II/acyl carrier protein